MNKSQHKHEGNSISLDSIRNQSVPVPPEHSLSDHESRICIPNAEKFSAFVERIAPPNKWRRLKNMRIAVDLDDTIIHGSVTCPGVWKLAQGYSDPKIEPGFKYNDLRFGWKGRIRLLRGRSHYDSVDRSVHRFFETPRVIVVPSVPMISLLFWLKAQGVQMALATLSARSRVEWLFTRLPFLRELFGDAVMNAEDLALRTIEATQVSTDCMCDIWKVSKKAHEARPLSLAAKTPWALAPIFSGQSYDLLIDDSELTARLFNDNGLESWIKNIPRNAYIPQEGWRVVADTLSDVLGTFVSDQLLTEITRDAPKCNILRFEDPLYLPFLHNNDQFERDRRLG